MSHKANKPNMPARSRLRSLLLALAAVRRLLSAASGTHCGWLLATPLTRSHMLTLSRCYALSLSLPISMCVCVWVCVQFILICLSRRLCKELICDFETIKLWARKRRKKQRILILFYAAWMSSLICCQIHVCVYAARVMTGRRVFSLPSPSLRLRLFNEHYVSLIYVSILRILKILCIRERERERDSKPDCS